LASIQRRNNFDLLRLLAAYQVVYFHASEHLGVAEGHGLREVLEAVLGLFPGVPVFFVISGFLISLAYERSPSVRDYARNRFLRLYPALWVCFACSLLLLAAFGQIDRAVLGSGSFWLWVLGQTTIAPWNLAAFRDFGVGVINGSLWTIPVELTFYAAVPVLYALVIDGPLRRLRVPVVAAAGLVSFGLWFWTQVVPETGLVKLVRLTLPAHLFMFLFGFALQRRWDAVRGWIEGRAALWLGLYVAAGLAAGWLVGSPRNASGAGLAVAAAVQGALRGLLAVAVVSAAFTAPEVAHRCLRGHDVSYGVYLYHAPAINACLAVGFTGFPAVGLVAAAAGVLGAASWILVERPALRRKRSTIHRVSADA
jgi:peptidoglycan/LPS O-acetylase OafA/YrhL